MMHYLLVFVGGGLGASLRHGVLRIEVPKAERARPRRVEVKV